MEKEEVGAGHRDHAEPQVAFRRFALFYPNGTMKSLGPRVGLNVGGMDKCFK